MLNIIDKDISLHEPGHKYVLASDPTIEFQSVTEVIENYFERFDKHAIANKLVETHPKYIGMEASKLIDNWDSARDYGSKVHREIELKINKDIEPVEDRSRIAIDWLNKYKKKSQVEIYSEVIIYSKKLKIAGSIDIISYDIRSDKYEIIDWKTSKSIDTTSFNGKMGTHSITSHLMDCNFVRYSMQLSFYRYLLEKYYRLKINNQLITHLDGEKCIGYIGRYYKKEVMDIIQDQKIRGRNDIH